MRISDWSSAVCSSDLGPARDLAAKADGEVRADQSEPPRSLVVSIFVNGDDDRDPQDECKDRTRDIGHMVHLVGRSAALDARWRRQTASRPLSGRSIGRAAWRERGCTYGSITVVADE